MKSNTTKGLLFILGAYFICELVKDFEFLILKTDQTFLAENIFCKLFAVGMIVFCLKKLHLSWDGIGFKKSGVAKGAALGISLGVITFSLSYLAEYLILQSRGLHPEFSFYIANFAISNQNIAGISISALAICVVGNIVNVWAEEGLFRGLLYHIGKLHFTERAANIIQSALFGLWHIIIVIVWIVDGSIDIFSALIMAVGYVILAGILGYEWGLCAALTGTLWAGAFEHFFNNFIGNTLHVISETGVDELQIIRIVLSNVLSLLIVTILTKVQKGCWHNGAGNHLPENKNNSGRHL